MDFELTAEQQMWRESVHDFAAKEVKPRAGVEGGDVAVRQDLPTLTGR